MNKFSLAIVPFFAISSLGASSLKDAIINGKVSGAFQSYYFSRYKDSKKDNDILTLGLDISYKSASYKGFGVKTTVQTATSPWVDEHSKIARKNNMWGSGAQLSEAYLSYSFLKTIANIGRIYFSSPVMGASASRINKESFEGISIINSDIPDTIVTLGFMNKFQARTDENGKIGKFRKTFKSAASPWVFRLDNGAYTLALKNKSIENLTLVAAYLDAVDAFKTAYFQVDYKISNYTISSQYYSSKEEGKDRGYLLGFQGKVSFGALDLIAAFTSTGKDADVIPGLGNGADLAYTWSEVFAYQYEKDQNAYKLTAKYNINPNLYLGTSYLDENGAGYNRAYTAIKSGYNFAGKLKGLNIVAAYEMGSKDAKDDELRIRLNYEF